MIEVKICGLKSRDMVQACIDAGADYIGLNFVLRSPRFICVEAAQPLIAQAHAAGLPVVGLWQGAGSLPLEAVLGSGIDILQAQGSDPGPVPLPVWFALGVCKREDLPTGPLPYARLLFDAKPPLEAAIEGGHGTPFDWTILSGYRPKQPWMLAGGLTRENVAQALALSGAGAVDVASGVESVRGHKDARLIRDFIREAKRASA